MQLFFKTIFLYTVQCTFPIYTITKNFADFKIYVTLILLFYSVTFFVQAEAIVGLGISSFG